MAQTKHFGPLAAAAGALVAVALLVLVLVLVNPQTAEATLPGKNGRIAYAARDGQDMDIFTVSPNFGAPVQLTFNTTSDHSPSYSPDGNRIAYVDNAGNTGQIFTMNTDGTGKFQVTPNTADVRSGLSSSPGLEAHTSSTRARTPTALTWRSSR
jgi:hypothetical protein